MRLKTLLTGGLSVFFSQGVQAEKCGGGQDLVPGANLVVGHTRNVDCPEGKSGADGTYQRCMFVYACVAISLATLTVIPVDVSGSRTDSSGAVGGSGGDSPRD